MNLEAAIGGLRAEEGPQLARRNVIVGAMIGAGICLGLIFTSANLTLDALFSAGGFFCLELVIGPIWSIPMDIAPQYDESMGEWAKRSWATD